ncbi:MAG: hypothetical protein KA186_06835 [Flavobacteriales bacterium]|nr:hypothetical protein [Flavobacteriales bacterium]
MRSISCLSILCATCISTTSAGQAWLDLTVGPDGYAVGAYDLSCYQLWPMKVHITSDDKILITGQVHAYCNVPLSNDQFFAARFHPSGAVDSTFGTYGIAFTNPCTSIDQFRGSVILSDGSIILAGYEHWQFLNDPVNQGAIAKLHPDGTLDLSYGLEGIRYLNADPDDLYLYCIAATADDKLIVLLRDDNSRTWMCKLDHDGSYDTTFANGLVAMEGPYPEFSVGFTAVKLQSDGKIVVVGNQQSANYQAIRIVGRYLPDGTLDPTFANNGWLAEGPTALNRYWGNPVIDDQDRIRLIGFRDSMLIQGNREVVRLMPNGTPDPTFGTNGVALITEPPSGPSSWENMDLLPDGRITYCFAHDCKLMTAQGEEISSFGDNGVATATFPLTNPPHRGRAIAIEADGSIIVATNAGQDLNWVRYFTDITTTVPADQGGPESGSNWSVHPNPFSADLFVRDRRSDSSWPVRFDLTQMDGRTLFSQSNNSVVGGKDLRLDLPIDLAPGAYLLSISTAHGSTVLPIIRSR